MPSYAVLSSWLTWSGEVATLLYIAGPSIGRASLLAASVLIRLGWDANAAFSAIQLARGCPVPDTEQQRRWVLSNVPAPDSP
jgi:hypothetical protein